MIDIILHKIIFNDKINSLFFDMMILIKFIIILSILSPLKSYDFDTDTVKTKELTYAVELFSDGYIIPWGMAFLPNRQMLVADLSGKLYLVSKDGKSKSEISGVPEVYFKRQGGLMDVEIDPNFSLISRVT